MITLLTKIKDELEADSELSQYVEIVDIRKYRPDELPEFENYGIIVSPGSQECDNIAVAEKQWECEVKIVALVFNYDETKSLTGVDVAGDEVGILKMVDHIFDCLRNNELDGHVEVTGKELSNRIDLNAVPSSNREGFYHEVEIESTWLLQSFIDD
jgi:hypothetical protein